MLLHVCTVLMHVGSISSPAASLGARIYETGGASSPDATRQIGFASVSPTSVRFSRGREAGTLPRSLDFSSRSHPVAPSDHAGHSLRFSGRSDTARESALRLGSSAVASLPGARGMHRHSGTLPGVLSRGGAPRRHRRRSLEHLLSRQEEEHDEGPRLFGPSSPSTGTSGTSTSRWRVSTPCETCFAAGTS